MYIYFNFYFSYKMANELPGLNVTYVVICLDKLTHQGFLVAYDTGTHPTMGEKDREVVKSYAK